MHSPDVPSFSIRGVSIAAIDLPLASQLISGRAVASRGDYVTVTGAHGVVELSDNERWCGALIRRRFWLSQTECHWCGWEGVSASRHWVGLRPRSRGKHFFST